MDISNMSKMKLIQVIGNTKSVKITDNATIIMKASFKQKSYRWGIYHDNCEQK